MRGLWSEILSVLAVLSVSLALASAFPRAALVFSASRPASCASAAPSAAIVFLDDAAVARAMRATRSASRDARNGRMYIDLRSAELPGADLTPMMTIGSRSRANGVSVVESGRSPYLPSRRAATPVRISAEAERDELPFPRAELLKMN